MRPCRPGALAALALAGSALPAAAQVVERNLPPAPQSHPEALAPPVQVPLQENAAPIGPAVRAIVLLDATEPVRAAAPDGVTSSAEIRLTSSRAAPVLRPFLGRPLSHKLIGEAEAAVAKAYRKAGYPFLAVALPEQEVTGGMLQLRVIEFRVGRVAVQGAKNPGEARAIAGRVRLTSGQAIYAPAVSDDLDWLNRDPFRKVSPVFTRGASLGLSDVRLQVQDSRPFTVYGGYANSGSPSTGLDRYFAGAEAGGLLGFGSLISYQVTASGDALFAKDRPFSSADRERYISQAARVSVQPFARAAIEVAADYVDTNQPVQDFVVNQKTYEGAIDLRFALSDLSQAFGGWGDGRIGVAGKRQQTRTFFGDTDVADAAVEDYQLQVGYSRAEIDRFGRSDLDLLLHLSPGGIDEANSRARLISTSQGRLGDARYAYIGLTLDRTTVLPWGLFWRLQAIGQYSAEALPSTEEAGLGQQSLVRGYTLDDGAYDRAIVLRNELRGPVFAPRPGLLDAVAPYALLDYGRAVNVGAHFSQSAASIGLGLSALLASRLSLDADLADALTSAPATHAGDWRLESRITITF